MVSWELIYKATCFIAEEMGVALKRSAFSPNIRERMDHSCAVLDEEGRVVAQAEHIPVHLGSLRIGVSNVVKWLMEHNVILKNGDTLIVNDPYIAGTHLNDIMLLTPVFYENKLVAYVVNKAHHVDIGGPAPGSINPEAKTLYEEGLVIPPLKLVNGGKVDDNVLSIIYANTKTPEYTVGDLYAQLAANNTGARLVRDMIDRWGLTRVREAWDEALSYARRLSLLEISRWPRGTYFAEDYIELNGGDLVIRVQVRIGDEIYVDFTGSSSQVDSPLNAVYGVTYAASAYAIRSLFTNDIPVNEGFYSTIHVDAPFGSILNPVKPAPVSGGNMETSQRIVDVIHKALSNALPEKVPAAGSGTMMNIMIGGKDPVKGYWSYYETIGGGTGGRPGKEGVSAVHVNMTNTMNTPIEIIEREYPLFFIAYRVRENSGGKGLYRGGEGIVRAFVVLKPARLSIMADRFRNPPWGLLEVCLEKQVG